MAEISDHITTSGNECCCLCGEYFIGSNLSKGIRCVYSLAIMALMPDHLTLDDTHSSSPAHISNITIYKPNSQ